MGESQRPDRDTNSDHYWDVSTPFVWIAAVLAVAVRVALLPFVSEDSTFFLLPWMEEFRKDGAAALGGDFSNYNFPYLFLMFLASLLPVDPLIAIKVASLFGDVLLAISVAALFAEFRPAGISPRLAALIALFVPTVLINASMWGQCDAIYTAFLILTLRSLLRDESHRAWLFWAVALAFKLQAVFFLPALVLISLRNRYSPILPAISIAVWAVLSLPPVLFGRPLLSTLSIYANQTQEYRLVAGAANIYAWFPTATAEQGKIPAILICGLALLLVSIAYWRGRDSSERRVLLAVTVLATCPLLLPQMHDRYFFAAEVMALLFLRRKHLFLAPWFFAATGAYVYALYFQSNQYALPLMLASIPQCVAVGILFRELWRRSDQPAKNMRMLSSTSP